MRGGCKWRFDCSGTALIALREKKSFYVKCYNPDQLAISPCGKGRFSRHSFMVRRMC